MKLSTLSALKLSSAALVMVTALAAVPVLAQDAPTSGAASPANDVIIVTGSRIARPQTSSSVPVAVISAQSITSAGQTNLLDAIQDLPIAGQTPGRNASNFSNSGNGEATVNLRNLGASRTLVLVNGRRSVGVPGGSAVDLNNIPTDLIDHVEIVTGGASAIYGSDAVAGVVNIILKNKFTGLEMHVQDLISGQGDGNSKLASLTGGTSFGGGKGGIVANFTYTKDDAVRSSDRSYSKKDSPGGSGYTPQGATISQSSGNSFTFDSNNNVIPYTGAQSQRFNRASERLLSVPVERYSGSLLAHYDFAPSVQAYAELSYDKTKASGTIEPLAVDDGYLSGAPSQGQSVLNFDGSSFLPGISSSNPFLPAAIAADAGPGGFVDFRKRSNGIFDRSPHDSRDFWRGVIGLKGDISTNWHFDASYEHSQVRDDTYNGAILLNNYGAALQATTIGGQIVCADAAARAAGCVPINIFGNQTYTAAQLKFLSTYVGGFTNPPYVGASSPSNFGAKIGDHVYADFLQKSYQDVATVSLNGSLFKLPDGPLSIALGAEYHHERVSEVYDPFTQSGASSQQQNGNEFGSTRSKEGFVEINAPIFGHHQGIYALSLEAAARYADYSRIGGVWTYKYGGTYAPSRDLRFRAIYARAVRAPNLNELYSPTANTAQQVVDPCDQAGGAGVDVAGTPISPLPTACTAIPGIANYLKTNPNFAYSLAQVQTIFGLVGGNPNLQPEATNTFTVGASLTPTFLRNFYLTADYYTIKVKNAVATVDPQTAVTQCFNTGNPSFCNLVHRNSNGFITEVDGVAINAASYLVSGLDIQSHYMFNTHVFHANERFVLDVYYNHKFKQQQTPFAGGPISSELGAADTYASQQLGSGFKNQFTINSNFATGPFSLNYRFKYLGPLTYITGATVNPIPAYTYHDIQAKLTVDNKQKFEFYVGCNNVFDKQPPLVASGNSQWPGTNTVADTYDLIGRTLYAGVTAKF